MEYLSQHIESLIFTAQTPISFDEIKKCLEETFESKFKKKELDDAIEAIMNRYKAEEFAFEVVQINNGYQFLTKGAYHQSVGTFLRQSSKKRLSKAAVETLSIIAYKQPVSKSEMEKIRGVSCDYSVQKLLEKELIAITGRSEGPGRPLLYGTSEKFMDYFGINSLADLPKPKDFREPDNTVGESAPIEEDLPRGNQDSATDEVTNDEETGDHLNIVENSEASQKEESQEEVSIIEPTDEAPILEATEISEEDSMTIIDPDSAEDDDQLVETVDEIDKLKQLSELDTTELTEIAPIEAIENMPIDNLNVVHVPDVVEEINQVEDKETPAEVNNIKEDIQKVAVDIETKEAIKETPIEEEGKETPAEINNIKEDIQKEIVDVEATEAIKETPTEAENLKEDISTEITDKADIKTPLENLKPPTDVISEEE